VAAFDPQTQRYVTKVTPGVAIHVVDVPRLDPAAVAYRSPTAETSGTPAARSLHLVVTGCLAVIALLFSSFLARAAVRQWQIDPGRWLVRRARRMATHDDPARTARAITDTLAGYLEQATGRPRGVLTPDEARAAVAEVSGDAALSTQAAGLVAECDRACFASADCAPSSAELVTTARRIFEVIGRKRRR
jgi:hypothetical protein